MQPTHSTVLPVAPDELCEFCKARRYLKTVTVKMKSKRICSACLNAPSTPIRVRAKTGRNDPCHCDSGLKFKKCHGKPV